MESKKIFDKERKDVHGRIRERKIEDWDAQALVTVLVARKPPPPGFDSTGLAGAGQVEER